MPFYIAVFDWSLYTLPPSIPTVDVEGFTNPNDPAAPDYSPTAPTWIGETFTFNGGASIKVEISDDDGIFEDGYVETGGAQTLTQDVTINGTTYSAGSVIENEFSLLDAVGNEVFVVRIDGVNIGFGYPVGQEPTNGDTFTSTTGRDGDPFDSADGVSSNSEPYVNIVCFAEGTLIATPEGERRVESLKPGDQVITQDHGAQTIRWTRKDAHSYDQPRIEDKPVLIAADALGANLPVSDLIVSPHHRILVGGSSGQLSQIIAEGFAPAKSLTCVPGIRHMKGKRRITWVHFACDRHEVITANGCLSESLLLGPMVVNGMTVDEKRNVTDVFGVSLVPGMALNGPPARPCFTVHTIHRHLLPNRETKCRLVTNGSTICTTQTAHIRAAS